MGWAEVHAWGAGTTRQVEDAHRAFDAVGIPTGPLAVRALAAVGKLASNADTIDELRTRPMPWSNVREAIRLIEQAVAARGLGEQSLRDQLQSYVRDVLDTLDVSVADPVAVYHGFVFAGLMVEMAKNAHYKGNVTTEALSEIAHLAQSLAAALIPYVPEEVRNG